MCRTTISSSLQSSVTSNELLSILQTLRVSEEPFFQGAVTEPEVAKESNLSNHGARLEFQTGNYSTALPDGRQNLRGGNEGYENGAQLWCKVNLAKRAADIQATDSLIAKVNTKHNSENGTSANTWLVMSGLLCKGGSKSGRKTARKFVCSSTAD